MPRTLRPLVLSTLALIAASTLARAEPITTELIAAAEKEGKVVYYTTSDIENAQALVRAFQAKYPKIKVEIERNGAERTFQRVNQEYGSNIYNVDVLVSGEMPQAHYFKKQGWLAPFVPDEVEKLWPKDMIDKDRMYVVRAVNLVIISYNTNLVKAEDAPKGWKDLLDPKWRSKMVKAHPSYSGTSLTGTYLLVKMFGWDYFAQLAKQNVMQVQSAQDPPKKTAIGERAVAFDGSEQATYNEIDKGAPLKVVYPVEGVLVNELPLSVMAKAPHPNAARLFFAFHLSAEGQQIAMDNGNTRGLHPDIKPKNGQPPLTSLKYIVDHDFDAFVAAIDETKKTYDKVFVANNK